MPSYKNILLASALIDDGPQEAMQAAKLAEDCGARLAIVHTICVNSNGLQRLKKKQLAKIGKTVMIPAFDQHLMCGDIAQQIIKTAANIASDLIILGNNLESKQQKNSAIIHSILTNANCDVTVMRKQLLFL